MAKSLDEMKFKIGDCVRGSCLDPLVNRDGITRGVIVERYLQECHGWVQENYKVHWFDNRGTPLHPDCMMQLFTPECLTLHVVDDDMYFRAAAKAIDFSGLSQVLKDFIEKAKASDLAELVKD